MKKLTVSSVGGLVSAIGNADAMIQQLVVIAARPALNECSVKKVETLALAKRDKHMKYAWTKGIIHWGSISSVGF